MLAKFLTYLLIGALLVAAMALAAPQYLTYLWFGFGFIFVIGVGYLTFIYTKRVFLLLKQTNNE
ncbi:hypothetical protein ACLIA0_03210 [Bacillaceae bacterium W0354]